MQIILPERVRDVKFKSPYDVKREKDEMHYTYLDYGGRPVITATKKNLIEKHIANFEARVAFLREPLTLISAAFVHVRSSVDDLRAAHAGRRIRGALCSGNSS